jgi:hypothetical protein
MQRRRRHGTAPAPQRKNTVRWKDFIRTHLEVMAATDFFTAEVLTWKGPVTYYVLFFIHLESRRICVSGITRHPDQEWMEPQARAVAHIRLPRNRPNCLTIRGLLKRAPLAGYFSFASGRIAADELTS